MIKNNANEKGKCGLNCEKCPYFGKLCNGCCIETCLVDQCIKGTSYSGITCPTGFCSLRPYCPIGGEVRPPSYLLVQVRKKPMKKVGFPSFVPEVDVIDQRSWLWKEGIQVPAVLVRLWQLLTDKNILSRVLDRGLH